MSSVGIITKLSKSVSYQATLLFEFPFYHHGYRQRVSYSQLIQLWQLIVNITLRKNTYAIVYLPCLISMSMIFNINKKKFTMKTGKLTIPLAPARIRTRLYRYGRFAVCWPLTRLKVFVPSFSFNTKQLSSSRVSLLNTIIPKRS